LETIDTETPAENEIPDPDDPGAARLKLISEARKYRKRAQEAERLLGEINAQHAGQIAASDARAERLAEMLSGVVVADRLKSVLASRGVTRVDQAASLLSARFDVSVTDVGYAVQVRDSNSDANAETSVEQIVDGWLADNRHYLPPSGDTGSGAYPGVISLPAVSIEQLDLDPARKAEFVARHGPAALVQLARSGRNPRRR